MAIKSIQDYVYFYPHVLDKRSNNSRRISDCESYLGFSETAFIAIRPDNKEVIFVDYGYDKQITVIANGPQELVSWLSLNVF